VLRIGCEVHGLAHWREHWREIAQRHGVTVTAELADRAALLFAGARPPAAAND
jgi:hypothetical protein